MPTLPLLSNDETWKKKLLDFHPPQRYIQSQNEIESNKVDLIIKCALGVSGLFTQADVGNGVAVNFSSKMNIVNAIFSYQPCGQYYLYDKM